MYVQLLKNMSQDFMAVFSPPPTSSHVFNEESTLCDWFRSFVSNYTYMHDAVLFLIV